jgi:mxaA protein
MLKFTAFFILFFGLHANSFEDPKKYPDLKEKFFEVSTTEPEQRVGYHVGDILHRQVRLTIKEPYQLIEESLPIVGYEKRYRGQVLGITLRDIQKRKKDNYIELDLTYQIFTNNVTAKPAFITADYYRVINKNKPDEVLKVRIPDLTIAVSPIAIFGDIKVEKDMSDFRGPFLINTDEYKNRIFNSFVAILITLLILFYIYTRFTILPGFKKTFLPLHKKFKKQKTIAIDDMIRATNNGINSIADASIFEKNLNQLYKKNSAFKNIDKELKLFYKISNKKLFDDKLKNNSDLREWLLMFVFHLHLCEKKVPVKGSDIKLIKI